MTTVGTLRIKFEAVTAAFNRATRGTRSRITSLKTSFGSLESHTRSTRKETDKLGKELGALPFKKATTQAARFESQIKSINSSLTAFKSAAVVGFSVAVIKSTVDRIEKIGGRLREASLRAKQFGDSEKNMVGFASALRQLRIEADTGFDALQTVLERIQEAREGSGTAVSVFKQLGLDPESLAKLESTQAFNKIIESLGKIENSAQRTLLGTDLFGDEGARVSGLMAENAEKISKSIKDARFDRDALDAADALAAASLRMEESWDRITLKVSPFLQSWLDSINAAFDLVEGKGLPKKRFVPGRDFLIGGEVKKFLGNEGRPPQFGGGGFLQGGQFPKPKEPTKTINDVPSQPLTAFAKEFNELFDPLGALIGGSRNISTTIAQGVQTGVQGLAKGIGGTGGEGEISLLSLVRSALESRQDIGPTNLPSAPTVALEAGAGAGQFARVQANQEAPPMVRELQQQTELLSQINRALGGGEGKQQGWDGAF